MRRAAFHIALSLVTFWLGISFTNAWNLLHKTRSQDELMVDLGKESNSNANLSVSSAEQELREIYKQYALAQTNHDAAFFERTEAEEFILFRPGTKNLTRSEDIELMKTLDPNIRYTNDDLQIQFYGNAAIVTGLMTATFKGGGYSWPWIDVCVRRNGRWQILSTTQVN